MEFTIYSRNKSTKQINPLTFPTDQWALLASDTKQRGGGRPGQARGSRRRWGEAAAAAPADGEQGGGGALGSRAQARGGGAAQGVAQRRWRRRAVAPAAALG